MRRFWAVGRSLTPVSSGRDGPYTSASSTPTVAPLARKQRARLMAVVLLPTPPFPEATAIVLRTPGSTFASEAGTLVRVWEVIVTSTEDTPSRAWTRSRALRSNSAFTGQAGVVSSMSKATSPPSMRMFFTKPSSTMLLLKSGSTIGRREASTSSSEIAGEADEVMDTPCCWTGSERAAMVAHDVGPR